MNTLYKTSLSITLIALISGCSGKSFTMQDYADEWFNDKEKTKQEVSSTKSDNDKMEIESTKSDTIKQETIKTETTKPKEKIAQVNETSQPKVKTTTPKKVEGAAIRKGVPSQVAWSSVDKHKDGQMQKSLDTWTEEEWNPTFEGDEEQAKKDANASEHFTLQHYMDKRAKYLKSEEERIKASGKPKPEANYEKMDKLPVIGK